MDYCNASSSRADRVYFPTTTNLNNNNPDYFKCNGYSCDVYCNGTANVEPSQSSDVSSSSSSSELDPNKNYTYTYTRTNVTSESETMTNETYETVIMTLDNSSETSYSTTMAMQVVRTVMHVNQESESLILVEIPDDAKADARDPEASGKKILLITIGLAFLLILAMIGIFLYRKTKHQSADGAKFDQMDEDLGYVKDPENEEFNDSETYYCDDKKDDVNAESFGVDKVPIYGSDRGESLDSSGKINQQQSDDNINT
ncbi:hypothetical protein TVAG_411690 [Trichomonas vaginalis G3]|uniref:Uncharacterized protein n=2 Tax=Trichomonas vaginalis (strain ATCC PRA-98 / G3) TaxID=412133 RepID=A2FYI8_TRIV3|nr:hypothetical protein TVAG_411690 [Trichomonas vaginalis G3]|eukprot:XP_001302959.1 hypothetical protein [Trichomonas vaginalis G3]